MCGFLAEFNTESQRLLNKQKFVALQALSHQRGPDSQGYYTADTHVQLGFNRLAILDTSEAGTQPMTSFGGRYTVVFNGEIYNHLELRKTLDYTRFKGHSDTETLTACLELWGIEKTVKALNGMFAITIYSHQTKSITLVRDFAGIKPLFYGWNGKSLVAASQYNQITEHPAFKEQSVNPEVLKLYMEQHFVPAPFGLYTQTYQVLPGEMIHFSLDGKKSHQRYWELPDTNTASVYDEKEALQLIDEALYDSIDRQLLSDVPLGAFLSGGVDSALIAKAISKQNSSTQLFTIGSDSKVHDESERAKAFATALQMPHKLWKLDAKSVTNYWDEAMQALHEPMADFSLLPTYLVSKLAKKSVTVALSGDGGDELFFGYERFWSVGKNIKFQHYPKIIRQGIYGFDKYTTGNKRVNSVLLANAQGVAHQGLHSRFRKEWLQDIAPDLNTVSLPKNYETYQYDNTKSYKDLLAKMRHAEFYGMMQKTLRKVDLASMGVSLETRVPFLDKTIIDASLKIDPLLSSGPHKRKALLKTLLHQKYPSMPEEGAKKGFSIPLGQWIKTDLKTTFETRLLESDLSAFGLERRAVEELLKTHCKGERDLKWPLFTIYALTQWKK